MNLQFVCNLLVKAFPLGTVPINVIEYKLQQSVIEIEESVLIRQNDLTEMYQRHLKQHINF